jgi:hypothetical protein
LRFVYRDADERAGGSADADGLPLEIDDGNDALSARG